MTNYRPKMCGARGHEDFMSIDDECDDGYSSKLFDQIIQWQLPVFNVSDEDEQRQKLRARLRTVCTSSDLSRPKRNFVRRKRARGITEIFPPKKVVVQRMRDLLCDLLRPESGKPHGTCYGVGDFILTRKAIRVWKLMEMCYQILKENETYAEGKMCMFLCHQLCCFPKESHVRKAMNDLEELMQCSRYSFGIRATKRAMVAGHLSIQVDPKVSPVKCCSGLELPKHIQVLQSMAMTVDDEVEIRCIIVVQEEKTLKALVNCPMFRNVPVILITTEGIPDFTTRFFLHRPSTEFPKIPVFGLVDCPSGLDVLCAYKYGNTGSAFERNKLGCGDMEWLGVTYEHILELQEPLKNCVPPLRGGQRDILNCLLEPLTVKDMDIVTHLGSFCSEMDGEYKKELNIMDEKRCKATTAAFEACFLGQGSHLTAYVLSKVYTLSSNIRWIYRKRNIPLKPAKPNNC